MHNVVKPRLGRRYIGNPPTRNVNLTSLPIARIVLILKAELFLRTTGVQQVRVVLRALVLLQLAKGASAPRISQLVPLTPQAIRTIARCYQRGGLESAMFEKQRPGAAAVLDESQKQRIIAMVCTGRLTPLLTDPLDCSRSAGRGPLGRITPDTP